MGRFLFWGFGETGLPSQSASRRLSRSNLALSVIAARCQLPRQRHALSVTFGDTSFAAALPSQALRASSPKGGATGVPGHFPLYA